ncbi:FAD:protein FMN transferase [Nocardioides halotolerans]|uniref:FAD:protein FMN transferase n=1 Tax=Nocardioides halotolerans TaxID=433660 RepID=UPI00048C38D9|nr:FAD:protein FMN transferase [Nocardioides halotolerans]
MSTYSEFSAFGTYAHLAVRRPEALAPALRVARSVVRDVDATCSRFRDDSDLARVNREPGRWVEVHPLLVEAVRVATEAAAATDGLVHPLLGRPMMTLGYDRDFGELREVPSASTSTAAPALDAWQHIELDEGRLRIPAGTALDLGSTAKAWAADLVATGIEQELGEPALVSLGGDLAIAAPDGLPWPVAVAERPDDVRDRPGCVVDLTGGGLATSSTQVRRWRRGGVERHHLLDPRTGLPAAEHWRTVTATGPTCVAANIATAAAVVLGAAAPAWLDRHDVTARLVAVDGGVHGTGGWPLDAERRAA